MHYFLQVEASITGICFNSSRRPCEEVSCTILACHSSRSDVNGDLLQTFLLFKMLELTFMFVYCYLVLGTPRRRGIRTAWWFEWCSVNRSFQQCQTLLTKKSSLVRPWMMLSWTGFRIGRPKNPKTKMIHAEIKVCFVLFEDYYLILSTLFFVSMTLILECWNATRTHWSQKYHWKMVKGWWWRCTWRWWGKRVGAALYRQWVMIAHIGYKPNLLLALVLVIY